MKKLLRTTVLFCSLIMGMQSLLSAQALTEEEIKAQLVKEWERAQVYTNEYLNTMPADKYQFRPTDTVRVFAEQMLHLASANVFLIGAATDATPPSLFVRDLEKRTSAQSKDSVVYFVNKSYEYAIEAIKGLPIDKWGETKKLFSFTETRFSLLLKGFEHQTHHRGQATIYIRTAGYRPPQEKLF